MLRAARERERKARLAKVKALKEAARSAAAAVVKGGRGTSDGERGDDKGDVGAADAREPAPAADSGVTGRARSSSGDEAGAGGGSADAPGKARSKRRRSRSRSDSRSDSARSRSRSSSRSRGRRRGSRHRRRGHGRSRRGRYSSDSDSSSRSDDSRRHRHRRRRRDSRDYHGRRSGSDRRRHHSRRGRSRSSSYSSDDSRSRHHRKRSRRADTHRRHRAEPGDGRVASAAERAVDAAPRPENEAQHSLSVLKKLGVSSLLGPKKPTKAAQIVRANAAAKAAAAREAAALAAAPAQGPSMPAAPESAGEADMAEPEDFGAFPPMAEPEELSPLPPMRATDAPLAAAAAASEAMQPRASRWSSGSEDEKEERKRKKKERKERKGRGAKSDKPGAGNRSRAPKPTVSAKREQPAAPQPAATSEAAAAVVNELARELGISEQQLKGDAEAQNRASGAVMQNAVARASLWSGCRQLDDVYERVGVIGEGAYGVVYKARDRKTGELVALKGIKMETSSVDEGFPITALRECNVLLGLRHRAIVGIRELVINKHGGPGGDEEEVYMVLELYETNLKEFVESRTRPFDHAEIKYLLREMLSATAHMHDHWVFHRDLKASNVLVAADGSIALGDFGLARHFAEPVHPYTPTVVTLHCRAPEILLGDSSYLPAVDMWAIGCIFGELLLRRPLLAGHSEAEQIDLIFEFVGSPSEKTWPGFTSLPNVRRIKWKTHARGRIREHLGRLGIAASAFSGSSYLSDIGVDLLERMLTPDPRQRITAREALEHAYFKEQPAPVAPEGPGMTVVGASEAGAGPGLGSDWKGVFALR